MNVNDQSLSIDATNTPLTKWPNEPSVRDLKQDLTEAHTHHSSAVSRIQEYLDNLNVTGKAKVNAGKGRSSIVPKLIRKQAEWRYPSLSEPFLSTDDLFKASPVTWADREGAQQNQVLLNSQFNFDIDKVAFIDEYVRAAVDEGTVICRVGWDFQEEEYQAEEPIVSFVENLEYGPLHEELAALKAGDPNRYFQEVPQELQVAHDLTMANGVPVQPVIKGMEKTTKTRTTVNKPTVEVCDVRNVIIDPSCQGKIEKAGFVIYSFETSKSELEKDGKYQNLDQINVNANSVLSEPDHASDNPSGFSFSDEARKKIVVYEYWGYWDIDNSGVVKPIVAAWVGDTLIRMEENPFPDKQIPFVLVQLLPKRKAIYGEPDGALLEDNQKIQGAITRGMIDVMGRSANGQMGMRKDALDAVNKRRFRNGQDYEYNQTVDPRIGMYMHTYPEIPASAQYMLEQQNMEAESLSGVKAYSSGVSGAALGDVAAGVRGALDAASKRELGILRRLSGGIIKIGRKFMAMNAVFLDEQETVRVTDEEFVQINRDKLAGHYDLKLAISTAEEDANKAEQLAFMLQTLGPNEDPKVRTMILADIARLRKMPDLAHKLENYQPEPDPHQQAVQQLELEKLMAEIEEIRSKTAENYAQVQERNVKASNIQSDTDKKNLDFVEQESGVTQERELQKHGEQARSQMELKLLDHYLDKGDVNERLGTFMASNA